MQPAEEEADLYELYLPSFMQSEFGEITEEKCCGWAL